MNNDITHCVNVRCPIKTMCGRHISAHDEIGIGNAQMVSIAEFEPRIDEYATCCDHFMELPVEHYDAKPVKRGKKKPFKLVFRLRDDVEHTEFMSRLFRDASVRRYAKRRDAENALERFERGTDTVYNPSAFTAHIESE